MPPLHANGRRLDIGRLGSWTRSPALGHAALLAQSFGVCDLVDMIPPHSRAQLARTELAHTQLARTHQLARSLRSLQRAVCNAQLAKRSLCDAACVTRLARRSLRPWFCSFAVGSFALRLLPSICELWGLSPREISFSGSEVHPLNHSGKLTVSVIGGSGHCVALGSARGQPPLGLEPRTFSLQD